MAGSPCEWKKKYPDHISAALFSNSAPGFGRISPALRLAV